MTVLHVKNWSRFQHYKHRRPPWIKLHRELLDDPDYQCLPLASMALAPMIWLLASESDDGSISADPGVIAFRLRRDASEVETSLQDLINKGFLDGSLCSASNPLARRKQDASVLVLQSRDRDRVETEAERETERETEQSAPVGANNGASSLTETVTGVPTEQREEYAEAVREAFAARIGKPTYLLNADDYYWLKRWMDAGIRLSVVLLGINETRGVGHKLAYYN